MSNKNVITIRELLRRIGVVYIEFWCKAIDCETELDRICQICDIGRFSCTNNHAATIHA